MGGLISNFIINVGQLYLNRVEHDLYFEFELKFNPFFIMIFLSQRTHTADILFTTFFIRSSARMDMLGYTIYVVLTTKI